LARTRASLMSSLRRAERSDLEGLGTSACSVA